MKIEFVGGPLDGILHEVADGLRTIDVHVPIQPMSDMVGEPDSGCLAAAVHTVRVRYEIAMTLMIYPLSLQKAIFKGYVRE